MKKKSSSCWRSGKCLLPLIGTLVVLRDVAEMLSVCPSHFFMQNSKETRAQRPRRDKTNTCYCSAEDKPLIRTHFIQDLLFFTSVTKTGMCHLSLCRDSCRGPSCVKAPTRGVTFQHHC